MSRDATRMKVRVARAQDRWGCTYEQYAMLRRMDTKPTRKFQHHKSNAAVRGIRWELKVWEWWTIWRDSGHWEHRGPGQGYVMCRYGDVGPYAVGNVFIATSIENGCYQVRKISCLPIGVRAHQGLFRAVRKLHGKQHDLGCYATPELAQAAYLSLGPIGAPEKRVT